MNVMAVTVSLPKGTGSVRGVPYACRRDPAGWRCGKCLRGLVFPKIGDTCRVCGCVVESVEET